MTYHVEYLIAVPLTRSREWLASTTGVWEAPDENDYLERGKLAWVDLELHVCLAPIACQVQVPQIPYSWVIGKHPTSMDQIAELDAWIHECLPGVPAVRMEEFLRLEWEEKSGRTWDQWSDPVAAFSQWVAGEPDADPAFYQFLLMTPERA